MTKTFRYLLKEVGNKRYKIAIYSTLLNVGQIVLNGDDWCAYKVLSVREEEVITFNNVVYENH